MITQFAEKMKKILVKEKIPKYSAELLLLKGMFSKEALKYSTQLLADLSLDQSLSSAEYLNLLYEVDEINHQKSKDLITKRLNIKIYNRKVGAELDALVSPYYRRLFLAYLMFVEREISNKTSLFAKPEHLALLLCKTVNAAFDLSKWRYFDDQPAIADTWLNVNKVFKFAEYSTLLDSPVKIYSSANELTTFSLLYFNGLMLNTLQKGNYSPEEIQLTSLLLTQWAMEVDFVRQYSDTHHQYYVNLNDDAGPSRVRAFNRTADYRYWNTSNIVLRVEDYLCAMSGNSLPQDSSIRSVAPLVTLNRLFKKLYQDWSKSSYKRQRRNAERKNVEKNLFVAHGIEQICQHLAMYKQALETEAGTPTKAVSSGSVIERAKQELIGLEAWRIADESEVGFGVDLGREPSNWIELGKIIGCQHPIHSKIYVVAEIKSIKKQKDGSYRAGLQILSTHSTAISLSRAGKTEIQEVSDGFYLQESWLETTNVFTFSCLFIPENELSPSTKSSIIIPLSEYEPQREFSMNIGSEAKTLKLGKILDKQSDWVRASIASIQ